MKAFSRVMFAVFAPLAPVCLCVAPLAAQAVPTDIQLPGSQPQEIDNLTSPEQCDNCHGGYDEAVEPAFWWRGSMMSHASRDPLAWAAIAVSEQDFPGSGDLCLRCHVFDGWMNGRSTPTDGSDLHENDATGVACHVCHRLVNPDGSEHAGVQNPPFVANDEEDPALGYYGSGMMVLNEADVRVGPYDDAVTPHDFAKSSFHRSVDFCGTCHDVSNSAVGDLAHNFGAGVPLEPGTYSGVPGAPVDGKAAFNNVPYAYGVVERTFSEYKASAFPLTLVSAYDTLPAELQAGSIAEAYAAATAVRPDGNYVDGDLRYFSCQTCHMPPTQGKGCKQNQAPVRADLPLHDMTGGNYWMPDAMVWLDNLERLRLGGGMDEVELAALEEGKERALHNLTVAAALEVEGDSVKVVNLTGHKLITGYPEGRRMWLRVRWYDAQEGLLREDGEYGSITADIEGVPTQVDTLLDLHDPNTRIYEAHYGMTQEWAAQLLALGVPPGLVLAYDRTSGAVDTTLGDLAGETPGTSYETFHFVLNNDVLSDRRIPPFGMRYDDARTRNTLPVPADQYGNPGPGGVYEYWDTVALNPPTGAHHASIELLYQPTSWEYIQFLALANDGQNAFLEDVGEDLLDAWLATGMAAPEVMVSASWTAESLDCNGNGVPDDQDLANGTSEDCNENGVPDECDITAGVSTDLDGNGVPDECSLLTFCRRKVSADGCGPRIEWAGLPTLTGADDFFLLASGIPGQTTGALHWSLQRNPSRGPSASLLGEYGPSPRGSRLCVLRPTRTDSQSSNGTSGACDGSLAFHWSQSFMSGAGLLAGQSVYVQWVFIDPAPGENGGVGHTEALRFEVFP